jgi:hypothetical protein
MTREDILANSDVRPAAFVHFVLQTSRLREQVAFYKTFLNAWEVMGNDMGSFLTYDDEHHRVALAYAPGLADRNPQAAGVNHIAYAFKSLGDLLANYLRLKSVNIEPYWCINHGPTTSLYYADVDGNQIETQTDNYDTIEELNGFFQSEAFRENPFGIQFDPDLMVEKYRAGTPEEELKRQGSAPRKPGTEYVFPM